MAPLSFFLVFPDLFLSSFLDILVFPNTGFFYWISVSDYMAGMWLIPLFAIMQLTQNIIKKDNEILGSLVCGILAMVVFSLSEELCALIPVWFAKKVRMISNVAIYVVVPEGILGFSTFWFYKKVRGSIFLSLLGAFLTSMIYTGSLVLFFYIIEILI